VFASLFRLNYISIIKKGGDMPAKKIQRQNSLKHYNFETLSSNELLSMFPLPRYFQVHFSHIHEKSAQNKSELSELQQQADRIEHKIDHLLSLLEPK